MWQGGIPVQVAGLLPFGRFFKPDNEPGPVIGHEIEGPLELVADESEYQFEAKALCPGYAEALRHSRSIVRDNKGVQIAFPVESYADFPGIPAVERMFERIGDQLVDDQAARDRGIEIEIDVIDICVKGYFRLRSLGSEEG